MSTQKITARQGGGGAVTDVTQVYNSGAILTQGPGTNYIIVNPATLQAALTITAALAWHPSGLLYILFGGTIASVNPVITSFNFNPGAGQTKVDMIDALNTLKYSGESMCFRIQGTIIYRIS